MKKTILIIAVAAFFAACNNAPQAPDASSLSAATPDLSAGDTAGASQYQQLQEQQNNVAMQGVDENEPAAQPEAKPATKIIYRDRVVRQHAPVRNTNYGTPASSPREPVYRDNTETTSPVPSTGTDAGVGTGVGEGPVASIPSEIPPVADKKKGWSKAAKGTAIGAGSGAVLGAILTKDKGKGAVIGGIIGAAGGYVLGRKQDKKDGRY